MTGGLLKVAKPLPNSKDSASSIGEGFGGVYDGMGIEGADEKERRNGND